MTEANIAWAAGLFEGEGCIRHSAYSKGKGTTRELRLVMNDEDVVRRFHEIVGCGTVTKVQHQRHGGDLYAWRVGKRKDLERTLHSFLPYFGKRRRTKAEALLADPARPQLEDRTHCKRGHSLSGKNLYITTAGHRTCRACHRMHERRYYQEGRRYRKKVAA